MLHLVPRITASLYCCRDSAALKFVLEGVGVVCGVGFSVGVNEGFGAGKSFGVGDDEAFAIGTPLFQIIFLPDLMQVYLLPLEIEVTPTFVQEAPAFTAEIAGELAKLKINKAVKKSATLRMNRY